MIRMTQKQTRRHAEIAESPPRGAAPQTQHVSFQKLVLMVLALGLAAGGAGLASNGPAEKQLASAGQTDPPKRMPMHRDAPPGAPVAERFEDPLPKWAIARLGTRRFRHEYGAGALVFTRDGKTLVGHAGSGVVLWDAATGKELRRVPAHTISHASIDVSEDGATLAFARNIYVNVGGRPEQTPEISLWDLASGKKVRDIVLPYTKPKNRVSLLVRRVFFTPDGKSLVVCDLIGRITVFDAASGQVRSTFGDEATTFWGGAISPDSKLLAVGVHLEKDRGAKISLQLWDISTGKLVRTICTLANKSVVAMAFSPAGAVLASSHGSEIILHDLATGKAVGQLKGMVGSDALAFTPDGKKLLSGGLDSIWGEIPDRIIRVWDVTNGKVLRVFGRRDGSYYAMALSPDGKTVALGSQGLSVQLWDVDTGRELFANQEGHDCPVAGLAFSPDGKALFSGGEYEPILLWDATRWQPTGLIPGSARSLSLSLDGKQLVTIPGAGQARHANVKSWIVKPPKVALAFTIPNSSEVSSAFFSRDGRSIYTLDRGKSDFNTLSVRHWQPDTGKEVGHWSVKAELSEEASLAPDGRTVLGSWRPGGLVVYDVQSGGTRVLPGPAEHPCSYPIPSPDGRILASATREDSPIRLWELATRREILTLGGHQGVVYRMAWSPDGRFLASGDMKIASAQATQTVRLWDAASGKELAVFGGFGADVWSLLFAPDGNSVVAGLGDGTILVFDVSRVTGPATSEQRLGEAALAALWTDLASDSVATAHRAIGALTSTPNQSVPFLRERLKPVPRADQTKIHKWIGDLGSEKFAIRQAAAKEIENTGAQILGLIKKAIKGSVSLERRRRLEQLANKLADVPGTEALRTIRAIMALERIGSAEARLVLSVVARGAPEARETQEARASTDRLAR